MIRKFPNEKTLTKKAEEYSDSDRNRNCYNSKSFSADSGRQLSSLLLE